jgi:hypothetical protein
VPVRFETDEPVLAVARDESPPPFAADLVYNGTGRLKGRWEVVLPGDAQPAVEDLLTEGSLPVEQRARQRRYNLVERFDVFLPPTGRFRLPGPDPGKLPRATDGLHLILLRVEASAERESASDTASGVASSGGVAGFPLPVLRYYVGSTSEAPGAGAAASGDLRVRLPLAGSRLDADEPVRFRWDAASGAVSYRVEVQSDEEPMVSALLDAAVTSYDAPSWIRQHAGKALRWRVEALARSGATITRSSWIDFELEEREPAEPEAGDSSPSAGEGGET